MVMLQNACAAAMDLRTRAYQSLGGRPALLYGSTHTHSAEDERLQPGSTILGALLVYVFLVYVFSHQPYSTRRRQRLTDDGIRG